MFKFVTSRTFHVEPTKKSGVVRVRPTKGTYAKAWMPLLFQFLMLGGLISAFNFWADKKTSSFDEHVQSIPTDKQD